MCEPIDTFSNLLMADTLQCENMEELEEVVSTWQKRFEDDTKALEIIQQVANKRKF